MTVGKISALCWVVFGVMCVAFLPLGLVIVDIHSLPVATRAVLAVVVVGGLWWGPFAYAMYLALSVVRNGDKRLLRHGIAGTAEVLSAKRTNETIQEGEFAWEAPRVYKYRLRVSVPGSSPYETDCRICASGIRPGSTVNVAVSRHNRKRVTIDVSQASKAGSRVARATLVGGAANTGFLTDADPAPADSDVGTRGQSSELRRLNMLARLGELHRQGVLTDAEFDAQKAKILAE